MIIFRSGQGIAGCSTECSLTVGGATDAVLQQNSQASAFRATATALVVVPTAPLVDFAQIQYNTVILNEITRLTVLSTSMSYDLTVLILLQY